MKHTWVRWTLAVLITLSAAVYQRMTGPTYPQDGKVSIGGQTVVYQLGRSHGGPGDQAVKIALTDTSYKGYLFYRRYKTDPSYTKVAMERENGVLKAFLPHQPPAGKLEYFIEIDKGKARYSIPQHATVVTRFKGAVPPYVLIPHILFMFLAMLFSSISGLEALVNGKKIREYAFTTIIILFIGGMVLGPLVQKFAFGAYWTGIPFGWDLTDNKMLFALIGWLIAVVAIWKKGELKRRSWWVVTAAVILLLVFSIPHSMMGSTLDYSKMQVTTGHVD